MAFYISRNQIWIKRVVGNLGLDQICHLWLSDLSLSHLKHVIHRAKKSSWSSSSSINNVVNSNNLIWTWQHRIQPVKLFHRYWNSRIVHVPMLYIPLKKLLLQEESHRERKRECLRQIHCGLSKYMNNPLLGIAVDL